MVSGTRTDAGDGRLVFGGTLAGLRAAAGAAPGARAVAAAAAFVQRSGGARSPLSGTRWSSTRGRAGLGPSRPHTIAWLDKVHARPAYLAAGDVTG